MSIKNIINRMPRKEIMTPEKMKEYNQRYYAKKKEQIATKLYAKEACQKCGRMVSHQNINKHQKSSYCKSRCIDKSEDKFKTLEERITQYEKKIDEFKTPNSKMQVISNLGR